MEEKHSELITLLYSIQIKQGKGGVTVIPVALTDSHGLIIQFVGHCISSLSLHSDTNTPQNSRSVSLRQMLTEEMACHNGRDVKGKKGIQESKEERKMV